MGRRDGVRIKEMEGYHAILPYIMPKRTEAEVSLQDDFDITNLMAYLEKYNAEHGTNVKLFHAICTAVGRTIYHRPKLNIFISGRRYYQRNDITLSFVCKQKFEDEALETLMFMKVKEDDTLDSISKHILGDTKKARKEGSNDLDGLMNFVGKLPRFVLEIFFWTLSRLEYHGIMPAALTNGDPNYSTCILSNLGSIKAGSCYHHLSNYGTSSMMITIGTMERKDDKISVDMQVTVDERIADGFYFAKSLRLVKYLLENPEKLFERIGDPVPEELFK
ncbi:MAG: hypothetical protein Q4D13_06765 [Erysipelotrichaceae bacterium]|nr:hypothetical protein [Erysipelotrichaceae bacterium]